MVDLRCPVEWPGAVEATTVLHLEQAVPKALREADAGGAEEMGAQAFLLRPHAGPPGDVASPMQLDQRTEQWAEHDETISDPR